MYSKLTLAQKYISYYLSAANGKGHGMHSPFVFDLISKVITDRTIYPAYGTVEKLRKHLLNDQATIDIEDFGAGSSVQTSGKRSIASIAANAAKPTKYAQLLFRIVQYYKPGTILELGTSLGITSTYLAMGNPGAKFITMEGAGSIAAIAMENFNKIGLQNVTLVTGNFDDTLPVVLTDLNRVDFCFIDGNHRRGPTINYFNQLLSLVNNDTILVFDDIHWSAGMEQAWQAIREHQRVTCTIDLFFIGIVLFRKEFKEKQHFRIRF
jgi:predicted O-methyltransferase YrrM